MPQLGEETGLILKTPEVKQQGPVMNPANHRDRQAAQPRRQRRERTARLA
jgi:hypothetical protein